MGIRFTGLGIADISIDKIEERLFLIVFQVFQVFKALQRFFIKPLVHAFAYQVV